MQARKEAGTQARNHAGTHEPFLHGAGQMLLQPNSKSEKLRRTRLRRRPSASRPPRWRAEAR
eukprot:5997950-Alexandrium_andersonii.AAC.1